MQPELHIESPVVEGFLKGDYDFTTLGRTLQLKRRGISSPTRCAGEKPRGKHGNHYIRPNNFYFDLTSSQPRPSAMLGLPVEYPDDVTTGHVDDSTGYAR